MKTALREYAQASNQEIGYDNQLLQGRISHALRGTFTPDAALTQLLLGSGLRADRLKSGVYAVGPISAMNVAGPSEADLAPEVITIHGLQESLRSAIRQKQRALQIRDSIVAEDIGKLPDNNLVESLQRVSGIQIGHDHGEGNSFTIRGLSQVETLINGREIYSDNSRGLSFEYVPTDIFSGVDVYKNPAASIVEGGVGGTVNLKTHRPFDFKTPTVSLSLHATGYDLVRQVKPQVSGLISTRFNTGIGEVGLLLTVADIATAGRLDSIGVEPFLPRYNLLDFNRNGSFPGTTPPADGADAGDLVIAPNGGGSTVEFTQRHRRSADAVAQWRPNAETLLTLELMRIGYSYRRNADVVYANRGPLLAAPDAVFTFNQDKDDAPNVAESGVYTGVGFSSNSNYFDRDTFTNQLALSGKWQPNASLDVTGDLAFTQTGRNDYSGNIRIGNYPTASSPTLTFDLRGSLPSLQLDGFNFADASQYHLIDASHSIGHASGSGTSASLDVTRRFDKGPIRSLFGGLRYADHSVQSEQGTRLHMNGDLPMSVLPEAASPMPFENFYLGAVKGELLPPGMLGAPFNLLHDLPRVCQALGDSVCYPVYNPINTYSGAEKTAGVYGGANYEFEMGRFPVTGSIDARYVETWLIINGYRTSNTAQSLPLSQTTQYADFLPSFNARIQLTPKVLLRLSAARQMTRPNFSDLAPNLTLGIAAFTTLVGHAGNPDLRPLHAVSFDSSLEYYFNADSYMFMTLFQKNVDGFIQTVTATEPVAFPDYPSFTSAQISRPQNGGKGIITGYETGIQTFLSFLPSPYDGLGVQANYTRVDSHAPGAIAGTTTPLIGLSKNSFNLAAYYEKGPFHARIAYSYRDNYLDTIAGPGSGNLPIYALPFGTLDASFSYKVSRHVDLTIDAGNLTRAQYGSYFGTTDRPRFISIYDRRVGVTLRMSY